MPLMLLMPLKYVEVVCSSKRGTHDGLAAAAAADCAATNEDDVACGLARQSSLPAAAEAAHAADALRVCGDGVHSFKGVLTTGLLAPSIVLPPPLILPPPPRNCVEALCDMMICVALYHAFEMASRSKVCCCGV